MAIVWIPSLLHCLTSGADKATVSGGTLRQVLNGLDALYPGIKDALLDDRGEDIRTSLAVIIDGEASQLGLIAPVREDSEIHFIPAISGG